MATQRRRCAIYTRKSSEEGLDQDFNSLAAQREACEAYVASQAHEGWRVIRTHFDDGGRSGGSLDRPALQALMADIENGRVDVVVIYKIDRLTRSLTDFARLAELFDDHNVSFVAVTQQFNTTTSMGRLMLNVLLSFAQFEREITGERIRDKIAASKKKGMWMGGFVPLGYDAIDKQLVIDPDEASTVRALFSLYLEHGNVRIVHAEACRRGLMTKRRMIASNAGAGGRPFSRGHIYRILRNPLYAGWVSHQGELYEGKHDGIIDRKTWYRVQDQLTANACKTHRRQSAAVPGLLVGLLHGAIGQRLTHAHSTKGDRRYRYYIDTTPDAEVRSSGRPLRIPANQIESRVKEALTELLASPTVLLDILRACNEPAADIEIAVRKAEKLAADLRNASPATWIVFLHAVLSRVTLDDDSLCLMIRRHSLATRLKLNPKSTDGADSHEHRVPAKLVTRSGQRKLIIRPTDESEGGKDERLIRAVARAHCWFEALQTGKVTSVRDIADQEGLSASYVMRYLKLAFLAPDIVEGILQGRQPPGVSVRSLTNGKQLPADWSAQRALLAAPGG